mmetsp:Transcript_143160/g.457629  ORF Transcript_143160/g.457629 Transcript_143160/m.457629 type:complete len:177 (+) Transcript_143160:408-938(+)
MAPRGPCSVHLGRPARGGSRRRSWPWLQDWPGLQPPCGRFGGPVPDPADFVFIQEECAQAGVVWVCVTRTYVDQALNIGRRASGRMIHSAHESPERLQLQSTLWIGKDTEASCFPASWPFKRLSGRPFSKSQILPLVHSEAVMRDASEEFATADAVLPRLFQEHASKAWKGHEPSR